MVKKKESLEYMSDSKKRAEKMRAKISVAIKKSFAARRHGKDFKRVAKERRVCYSGTKRFYVVHYPNGKQSKILTEKMEKLEPYHENETITKISYHNGQRITEPVKDYLDEEYDKVSRTNDHFAMLNNGGHGNTLDIDPSEHLHNGSMFHQDFEGVGLYHHHKGIDKILEEEK